MDNHDLLLEIGTEELPASSLNTLAHDLAAEIHTGLQQAGLACAGSTVYATPRRIAVLLFALPSTQPDRDLERRGPAVRVAFDRFGELTNAGAGFVRSLGVSIDQLERTGSGDDERLVYRARQPGQSAKSLIPTLVNEALSRLSTHKLMRWGQSTIEFVRPVHWVVLLLGDQVIEAEILGVRSAARTYGHRFHAPEALILTRPAEYPTRLHAAYVIAAFEARQQRIHEQVQQAASALGGYARLPPHLVAENAALTEWPVVVTGHFDARFLSLPDAVIVATLTNHQRYFPVEDAAGQLLPHFIAISNIESKDANAVRHGNERVIRPRLEDAAFFYRADGAIKLEDRLGALDRVVFQQQLGSLGAKAKRIAALASHIVYVRMRKTRTIRDQAYRAGLLCKCDLTTKMVGEFPELQGIMGGEYARISGEEEIVAEAITETYLPRFAGDQIPRTEIGLAVALADKLDTLAGIFHVGAIPTGNKDPFALRRAAIGVLRIILEADIYIKAGLELRLNLLLEEAIKPFFGDGNEAVKDRLIQSLRLFLNERLRSYVVDHLHIPAEVFTASDQSNRTDNPRDFVRRVRAIDSFRQMPAAQALVAANKRTLNILRQRKAAVETLPTVNRNLFTTAAERELNDRITALTPHVRSLFEAGEYHKALTQLATLRGSVDTFFDTVKVMDDDEQVRDNRLALLYRIHQLFMEAADISHLQGLIAKTVT